MISLAGALNVWGPMLLPEQAFRELIAEDIYRRAMKQAS